MFVKPAPESLVYREAPKPGNLKPEQPSRPLYPFIARGLYDPNLKVQE